jgi:rubrerythrin
MKKKVPECWIHHVPMHESSGKSMYLDNIILLWKCPMCNYTEYRDDDDDK